ncbi:calcium-binding protein, partial [Arcobacteraceae bacterium]|nr:calcium-binding protein [Arcobacteraceae bacterium]
MAEIKNNENIEYKNNKVKITKAPKVGDNLSVYVRPGDEIDFNIKGIDLTQLDYKLVGGDIIIDIPNQGSFTFVSMALMGYNDSPPFFNFLGGSKLSLENILSAIEEVNDLPLESISASLEVKIDQEAKEEAPEATPSPIIILQEISDLIEENVSEEDDVQVTQNVDEAEEIEEVIFTSTESSTKTAVAAETETEIAIAIAEAEGVTPTLSFDVDVIHVESIVSTLNNKLIIQGGGGTTYSNNYPNEPDRSELVKQTDSETINKTDIDKDEYDKVEIYADNSTYFSETFTSRIITLNPNQPEGYAITNLDISGLPTGVKILGISGTSLSVSSTDDLSNGYTLNEVTGEIQFVIQYDTSLTVDFELTISAITTFDINNVSVENQVGFETPIETSLTYAETYGVNIKEVDENISSSYDYVQSADSNIELGFVLATNLNDNIIYTGETDTEVYGSLVNDTVVANSGDDTVYGYDGDDIIELGLGDDIVYGGENTLSGDVENDTLSYANFVENPSSLDEGVKVNLDSVDHDGLTANQATGEGTDTIYGIENLIGSDYRDTLIGSDENNTISGGAHYDVLKGNDGEDYLDGGTGNDTLSGGAGNDTLDGGEGKDTVDYSESTNGVSVKLLDPIAASLGSDYGTATDISGTDQGSDRLYNIENIVGSDYDDTFIGTDGNNTISGGTGDDTVDFSNLTSNGIDITLKDTNTTAGGYSTGDGTDYYFDIENVIGTNSIANGDTIIGSESDNYIQAERGDDYIELGLGDDTVEGGDGTDTLSYKNFEELVAGSGTGVTINLATGIATGEGTDTISEIENVTGTNFNDTITGDSSINTIEGLSGSDTVSYSYVGATTDLDVDLTTGEVHVTGTDIDYLSDIENIIGGEGDDTITGDDSDNILDGGITGDDYFIGNEGDDTFIGGSGTDTVDYTYSGYNINITLDDNGDGISTLATPETDTLEGIENIVGTISSDIIISTDTTNISNSFSGAGGNDTLDGGSGDDYLDGGSGDDYFYTTTGNDTILAGETEETNGDTIDFSKKTSGTDISLSLANGNGASYTYENGSSTATDTLYGIENIIGNDGDDTFTGSTDTNTIQGAQGADTIYGSIGNDYLDGGDDIDLLDYSFVNGSLTIDLTDTSYQTVFTESGTAYQNKILNIENIQGSGYDDIITGNSLVNVFYGGANDDTLDGGANNDTLYGESGDDSLIGGEGDDTLDGGANNDTLNGGIGDDTLDGGDGIDTVDYSNALDDLTIDLSISNAETTISHTQGKDTFIDIEGAIGGSGDDIITGTTSTNILSGGYGDDTLLGNGTSADGGTDTLIGGEGSDFISFNFTGANGVTVDLSNETTSQNTGAGNVLLESIENLEGSDGDDILIGNSDENTLIGRDGKDTITGGSDNDTLFGGTVTFNSDGTINTFVDTEVDTADYSTSTSGIVVDMNVAGEDDSVLNTGTVTNDGFVYSDTLYGIENIIGSESNDTIIGDVDDNVSNTFYGEGGDDTLIGGSGDDRLDGGDSTIFGDTADYSQRTESINATTLSVTVDLDANGFDASDEVDTLVNIENITGGSNDDTITGDTGVNTLIGNAGEDTLQGGSGNDYLDGGDDIDTVSYQYITSSSNKVVVDLAKVKDHVLESISGDNYTDNLKNIENVIGSFGDDEITGDTNANTLTGGSGDDILDGGGVSTSGTDSLIGGDGDDNFIVSNIGATVYDGSLDAGGSDVDTVDFSKIASSSTDTVNVDLVSGSFTLNGNAVSGTTFIGIEGAIGGAGDDTIKGTSTANSLVGGTGDDTLIGNGASSGTDYINGGEGGEIDGDFVSFSNESSNISVDLSIDTVQTSGVGDLIIKNIENLEGGTGNDNLSGNDDDNILQGLAGDDTLVGGKGDDTLDGGDNVDTADYSSNDTTGIKVDLSATVEVTNDGYNSSDNLNDIEVIKGSNFDDTIVGATGDDIFYGGLG